MSVVCSGCAVQPGGYTYHEIDVSVPDHFFTGVPLKGILEVSGFSYENMTDSIHLLYTQNGETKKSDMHLWESSPSQMIMYNLVDFLNATTAAQTVVSPKIGFNPDYIAKGSIIKLHQIIENDGTSYINVALRIKIMETDNSEIILSDTYHEQEHIRNSDAVLAVEAINLCLQKIFTNIATDIKGQLS